MSGPEVGTRPQPDPARAIVVVPTYNERETFPALADAVLRLEGGWRLLVVDDNSPDGTGQMAGALARSEPRVSVLHRERKEGLGPAYLAGFKEALSRPDVDFICQMDADFSHDPNDLAPAAGGHGRGRSGDRVAVRSGGRHEGLELAAAVAEPVGEHLRAPGPGRAGAGYDRGVSVLAAGDAGEDRHGLRRDARLRLSDRDGLSRGTRWGAWWWRCRSCSPSGGRGSRR